MLINGPVLRVERITGSQPEAGDRPARSWDFTQVHVLDGVQVHACNIGRDFGQTPGEGEHLLALVDVATRRNSRTGAYEVSVSLVRRVDPELLAFESQPLAARAA